MKILTATGTRRASDVTHPSRVSRLVDQRPRRLVAARLSKPLSEAAGAWFMIFEVISGLKQLCP